jgi:hypothetical protein
MARGRGVLEEVLTVLKVLKVLKVFLGSKRFRWFSGFDGEPRT